MHYSNLPKYKIKNFIYLLLIFPILFLSLNRVSAVSVGMQETDLSPGGEVTTLHTASDGSVFLINNNNELWVFTTNDWNYSHYLGIGGDNLADIAIESPTKIWWTDNGTNFGSFNLTTNTMETWEISESTTGNSPNLGPIVFNDGFIWMPTWFGPTFGMFRFNISTEVLELFPFTGGSFSSDLIYSDGFLWSLDWFKQSLMMFDIDTGELVKITPDPAREIFDTANIQTDGSVVWWTEDNVGGAVVSYDLDLEVMTAYQLPDSPAPRNLSILDGFVWYSDENGTIGRIDPDQAINVQIEFVVTPYPEPLVPESYALSGPITSALNPPTTGIFPFTDFDSDFSEENGYQVYPLPEGAAPWGIATINDFVIVADNGRQKLIRFSLEASPDDDESQFLPLILMP